MAGNRSCSTAARAAPGARRRKTQTTKVRLAVGGKSSLYYLPLTVTERPATSEAGLEVEISVLPAARNRCRP
jgi:hypothetical protein